jgi:hypothetical protein
MLSCFPSILLPLRLLRAWDVARWPLAAITHLIISTLKEKKMIFYKKKKNRFAKREDEKIYKVSLNKKKYQYRKK